MSEVPPIQREVRVASDRQTAFDVFTERISKWWPLAELSVYGQGSSVAFCDGVIVETASGQDDAVWGRVTAWEPPSMLAFTWHPGGSPERASLVTVTFVAADDHTLVRLEHAGWETFADPAAARSEYDRGWPAVLERFAAHVAPSEQAESDTTWVALLHRPTPDAPTGRSLFEHPSFAEHLAFLDRMRRDGYLIAAGPLTDEPGTGMTILRLPGPGRLAEATRLATVDDLSVATGFFTVTVRPWNVMISRRVPV
jgi:uncharacterized protein YndB with AHSA1/START domain/uncharacterized protein YciI